MEAMHTNIRFPAQEIRLTEAKDGKPVEVPKRLQVMRTGSFKHPKYGAFSIKKEHLEKMIQNFEGRARGIDIAVDYGHNTEGEAAAWIQKLEVEPINKGFGLFALSDWTPPAEEKIRNKEYKYLSADFTLTYEDAETGKNFGPTLLGAGLTNRPFIKGMDPVIQLSENENEGDTMNEQEKKEFEAAKKKAEELEASNKKLAEEKEAAEKKLSEKEADEKKRAEEADKEKKLSEKKAKFDKMLSEKKVVEAQREAFMSDDMAKFTELAQPAPKDVRLSENDNGDGGDGGDKDAAGKIIELAEKLCEKDKSLDIGKAQSMVLSDPANKKLREEYEATFK